MQIRYAVAGSPIQHSLSPVLTALTAVHLEKAGLEVELIEMNLIESSDLNEPMAWAWVNSGQSKNGVENRLYGDPANSDSLAKLLSFSKKVMAEVKAPNPSHVPHGDTLFSRADDRKTIRRSENESWISLTSPLKHLLSPRSGVHSTDQSLENGAVNQLRWDGKNWFCAGTDGSGLVAVAKHFGFDFQLTGMEAPLLCLVGGGGSARSCAAAWAAAGGVVWSKGGRRKLDNRGPWVNRLIEGDQVVGHIGMRLSIDFDIEPGMPNSVESSSADLHVISSYNSHKVGVVVQPSETGLVIDGRWLLVAQHLDAWAQLFSPEAAHMLPGLGLSMTRLMAIESALRAD